MPHKGNKEKVRQKKAMLNYKRERTEVLEQGNISEPQHKKMKSLPTDTWGKPKLVCNHPYTMFNSTYSPTLPLIGSMIDAKFFPQVLDKHLLDEINNWVETFGKDLSHLRPSHSYFNISDGPTLEGTRATVSTNLHQVTDRQLSLSANDGSNRVHAACWTTSASVLYNHTNGNGV